MSAFVDVLAKLDFSAEKMRKKKAARDKIMATKTGEKGLLIVNTGTGKGKTSAALGMVFRHIGHGYPVAVVQFTKSPAWDTGEAKVLAKFPELVTLHIMGEGFTWETQDRERDIAAATKGWERAKELIRDDRHRMVLLDELNIVHVPGLNEELGAIVQIARNGQEAIDALAASDDEERPAGRSQGGAPGGRDGGEGKNQADAEENSEISRLDLKENAAQPMGDGKGAGDTENQTGAKQFHALGKN